MNNDALDFSELKNIKVRAYYLGERIDTKAFESSDTLSQHPLTIKAGQNGYAVLFRYGAAVMFNLPPVEEANFLNGLEPFVKGYKKPDDAEEHKLRKDPGQAEGITQDTVHIEEFTLQRIQIIAEVMAKSVTLAFYETSIATVVEQVEPLAETLKTKGRAGTRDGRSAGKTLLRHIGETLLIQHRMVGRVQVHEKPDLLWDNPGLERFYMRLEDEYELIERHTALGQKLDLVSRTAETLLELLRHNSTLRVEWYITILIVIEIFITLYEMFIAN